ncbi:hypothetical protein Cadr_000010728 [Camelus dromedarius]|uniref:Uncharacterized protein n=1 Tax=Camelus dromedarius TaxID=9838 RepID=A0A5N4DTX5_CAMDR|nr:hypothetical protein Cadr_000010728 [Camelus dromedarius]
MSVRCLPEEGRLSGSPGTTLGCTSWALVARALRLFRTEVGESGVLPRLAEGTIPGSLNRQSAWGGWEVSEGFQPKKNIVGVSSSRGEGVWQSERTEEMDLTVGSTEGCVLQWSSEHGTRLAGVQAYSTSTKKITWNDMACRRTEEALNQIKSPPPSQSPLCVRLCPVQPATLWTIPAGHGRPRHRGFATYAHSHSTQPTY